jgi:two-component system sensor histidine kinase BarA
MHKISLKDWVVLLTIVPTALIGFGLAGYFSYDRNSELDEFLNLRAHSIIDPLAITGKTPLLNNNREDLRRIISSTHRSQSGIVKSIAVFTLDNQIFVTSAYHGDTNLMRLKAGEKVPDYTQTEHTDDLIIFRSPILNESKENGTPFPIGYIAIEIDKSRVKFKQQSQYIIAFTIAFLASLLSTIFALKLIKNVANPVNSMVQAIDRIREGKLESRVSGQLVGELNFLKNGINAMAESLGNYQDEMQGSIDQATVDLRESLEQFEIQNVELSIAKKKAQEVSKVKSDFLANMSHELRTPLNGVIGFTRQLLKTPLSDSQRDYLQTIDRSANNLLTIINDILDFSKLDAGKMVIESIPFSLREAIEDTLVLLAPSAHKKNIELSIKIPNTIPDSLLGDPMRIKQVMSNLVSNAIKFTAHGSVMIDVTFKTINTKRSAIKITVSDTGIGMNNKQQKAIFNAFSQADQSITRLHGGTGLGLVICQRLAYEMKGDVGFSSQENNGSTFWFKFECGVNTLSLSNELEPLPLANKTILYYEPNAHSRAATNDILLNWEMQVTQVENISQLTEALENSQHINANFDYALIGHDRNATALSDLKKIITQIKSQITNIHLAINSNSPSLKDALLASGAISCLSKPITAYKLYSALLADQDNLLFLPNKKILPIKVLAVDDNEANLKLINALLLEQVNEVVLADSGMEAFELCKNEKFDLIFMDIQMPIMDGISTLKVIKKDTCNSKTPVIAVTAHALSDEKEKMEQQGFNAYMTKPIDETMLNHIIYEYCDVDHFINFNKQQLSHTTKATQPLKIANKTPEIIDWPLALHRTGGKESLAKEILTSLVDSLTQTDNDINTALINKNSEQLKNLIHKLNGTCCYTGVPNLTTICQELETQLKNGIALDNLEPEFFELFEQIERISAVAPKFLAELNEKHITV